MFSFLETICISDGKAQHLDFHQLRVNETFDAFFPEWEPFDLTDEIAKIEIPSQGIHRLRITYTEDPQTIESYPMLRKMFKSSNWLMQGKSIMDSNGQKEAFSRAFWNNIPR